MTWPTNPSSIRLRRNYGTRKLGELCDIKIGKTPRRGVVKYWVGGTLPWATISEVNGGKIVDTNEKITKTAAKELNMIPFPKGTILYTFKLSIGRVGIAGADLFTNEAIAGLLIKDKTIIIPEWLFYILPLVDYWPFLSNAVKGNTLNKQSLQLLPISLPPLKTQKQIVERMDKIAEAQKLNDELIQKSDDLFQSLLHKELNPAGKSWEVKSLGDVAVFKRGPFGGSLKKEIFVSDGYKIYEQKNAIYNDFSLGNYFITKDKYDEMIDFAVKPGDLIISCSGTMGKVAIVPKNIRPGIINQALMRLTALPNITTAEYLKLLMDSSLLQKKLFTNTKGSAIQNVASVKSFKNTKVFIPPLATQKQIVEKLSAAQEYKKQLLEQKLKLKELFDSVLHKSMDSQRTPK